MVSFGSLLSLVRAFGRPTVIPILYWPTGLCMLLLVQQSGGFRWSIPMRLASTYVLVTAKLPDTKVFFIQTITSKIVV